jgi:hypothetical protein
MSAKSEGKPLYASEKSSKRARYNTADKALDGKKGESYIEDEYGHDYKHCAESKGQPARRLSEGSDPRTSFPVTSLESITSQDEIDSVDREFENLMHRPNEGARKVNHATTLHNIILQALYKYRVIQKPSVLSMDLKCEY